MKDNAFLANAGHFDVEINVKELAQMATAIDNRREDIIGYTLPNGCTINLLAEGRLVNLAAGNGHPAEIMDMSFSLQIRGLEYLVTTRGTLENQVYNIPDEIDYQVAWTKLDASGIVIDELTFDQIEYLGLN